MDVVKRVGKVEPREEVIKARKPDRETESQHQVTKVVRPHYIDYSLSVES